MHPKQIGFCNLIKLKFETLNLRPSLLGSSPSLVILLFLAALRWVPAPAAGDLSELHRKHWILNLDAAPWPLGSAHSEQLQNVDWKWLILLLKT